MSKFDNIQLPNYSVKDEIANTLSHIVGCIIAVLLLIFILTGNYSVTSKISGSIYAGSMLFLYSASSIYHGSKPGTFKRIMRIVDHLTIYLLIVGTYTPILIKMMGEYKILAVCLLGIEWGLALIAGAFTIAGIEKYKKITMVCYILMGWLIAFSIKQAIAIMTPTGFIWLLAGGVLYTIGAVFYGVGKKSPVYHTVFHIFVVLGTLAQAISIIKYVL